MRRCGDGAGKGGIRLGIRAGRLEHDIVEDQPDFLPRQLVQQAGMKLVQAPVRPKRNPLISVRLGNTKYETWKAFLDHAYWSVELR